jgi:ABC-type multidrug transport system fused ATPase/permease subunit
MFANKDATVEDIKTALTKSNAEFVQKLESGLDTYIGSSAI